MIDIRAALPEDAGAIAGIHAPHVLSGTVSFEIDPPDARAMRGSDRATRVEGIFARRIARAGRDARVARRGDVAERIDPFRAFGRRDGS